MSAPIRAVLFDCDGVLQRPANDWAGEIGRLTGLGGDQLSDLLDTISDAEQPILDGSRPFLDVLGEVVRREGVDVDPADLIQVWQHLVVDPEMLDAARDLESANVECALGTNQHRERAAYMRAALGYDSIFEPMIISAEIGVAKPDPGFFEVAVERIGLPAEQVLFVDDVLANVESARSVGLAAEHFAKDAGRPELDRILALHGLAERLAA